MRNIEFKLTSYGPMLPQSHIKISLTPMFKKNMMNTANNVLKLKLTLYYQTYLVTFFLFTKFFTVENTVSPYKSFQNIFHK